MGLDADDRNLIWFRRTLGEGKTQFRNEHGEGGFVDGVDGRLALESELGADRT